MLDPYVRGFVLTKDRLELPEFTEHESMNYASDTWKGGPGPEIRVVSSSFYDRRVCVWRVEV